MEEGVFDLVARLARLAAFALAACGLFLIFLDVGRTTEPSRLRRSAANMWKTLGATPIAEAPVLAVSAALRSFDRFVVYWFEQSERNVATAGAFTLLVFVAMPFAALLNWLRGGSPTLIVIMLASIVGLLILAALSELKRFPVAAKILAPILFATVFLGIPSYVFVSLTDRALNIPIAHGALTSLLIVPLLYLVCHSAILLGAGAYGAPVTSLGATTFRRVATLFVAFLPAAYLATFGALLLWHVIVPELPEPSTWRSLIFVVVSTALAAATAVHLVTTRGGRTQSPIGLLGRLGIGAILAAVFAGIIALFGGMPADGPRTLAFLPFAIPAILILIVGSAILAKAVLALVQVAVSGEPVSERPYRVAGLLALVLAAGAGWAAASL